MKFVCTGVDKIPIETMWDKSSPFLEESGRFIVKLGILLSGNVYRYKKCRNKELIELLNVLESKRH